MSLMYTAETWIDLDVGDTCKAHLNLGVKWSSHGVKTWSIKKASKTVGHVRSLLLCDCKFIVQPAANKKIRDGGPKTVHAFVSGTIVEYWLDGNVPDLRGLEVKYNPHVGMKQFCSINSDSEFKTPVISADRVYLSPAWRVFILR